MVKGIHLSLLRKFGVVLLLAAVSAFSALRYAQAQDSQGDTAGSTRTQNKPAAKKTTTASQKKTTARSKAAAAKRRHRSSPRLVRMKKAFVASASLKPMARQLLQDRTPAAFTGVESFARKHSAEDAGSLAWLVAGYARLQDRNYDAAIEDLHAAKAHAGDLGDYVSYYLASAYSAKSQTADAAKELSSFAAEYPASLLVRDAALLQANALLAEQKPQDAIAALAAARQPERPDIEFSLGKAYEAANDNTKAEAIFRKLVVYSPLSGESPAALAELQKLDGASPLNLGEQRTRADLLLTGKRYNEAADAYNALLTATTPPLNDSDKPSIQLSYCEALRKAGRSQDAARVLDGTPATTPDLTARRLFQLGEIARAANNDDGFLADLAALRQTDATHPLLEQALLSAGNIYLLRRDYDNAIDAYRELQVRFPTAAKASYAHWKVAWLNLRQNRPAEAKKAFEDQIALYPNSNEIPASLYWRGRLAEEDGDSDFARALYVKVSLRYKNFYYGELARERMAKLPAPASGKGVTDYPLLDHIPPFSSVPKAADEPPDDDLRVQKAHLLENGGLVDFAVRELRAAAAEDPGNWLAPEIARMYQDAGRYDLALETLKRAEPNYFAVDIPILPRPYWEALFPKAYWGDLRKHSEANGLDPYLVASLIRQESEFNPNAVSKKDAVGLMQLLPSVGKTVAHQEKIKHFSANQLFTPAVNLQLGTKYFKSMVDEFGSPEYALAAYNAGSDRVQQWMGQAKYRDVAEFVESIPFTETREYVEAIVRNANVYRQIYGTP